MSNATFSNIESENISYVQETLMAWYVRFEQEVKRKLLTNLSDGPLFAEHLVDALLRGDIVSRFSAYSTARQWGWMSANDVLEKENANPIGEQGDMYISPLNMGDASQMGKEPEPKPDEPDEAEERPEFTVASISMPNLTIDEATGNLVPIPAVGWQDQSNTIDDTIADSITAAHADLFRDRIERLLQIECDRVRRIMGKDDFGERLAEFYSEHAVHMLDRIRPLVTAIARP